jgi:biopolymer transport protein ExbB
MLLLVAMLFGWAICLTPVSVSAQDAAATIADDQAELRNAERKPVAVPEIPQTLQTLAFWFFVAAFTFASVIAMWFGIERMVVLRHARVVPKAFVERFIQHLEQGKLEPANALRLCEQNGSPVALVFAHGVRKWGKSSVEIEQAIIDGGERQVAQLRKHLRVLNGVATVTPLVGLLGTVWGMIIAFSQIAGSNAMGKAEELAAGIVLALVTTAVGLLLAIPALVVYMYLVGKVDTLVMEMDDLAQNVVHLISAEGLAAQAATPRKTSRKSGGSSSSGTSSERHAV